MCGHVVSSGGDEETHNYNNGYNERKGDLRC